MDCPRCHTEMGSSGYCGVVVKRCDNCRGAFIEESQLEDLETVPEELPAGAPAPWPPPRDRADGDRDPADARDRPGAFPPVAQTIQLATAETDSARYAGRHRRPSQ